MAYRPYNSYEVTIRRNGKRQSTVPFGNKNTMMDFIDGIIMDRLARGAETVVIKDEYKILIIVPKELYNEVWQITICGVFRDFENVHNIFS